MKSKQPTTLHSGTYRDLYFSQLIFVHVLYQTVSEWTCGPHEAETNFIISIHKNHGKCETLKTLLMKASQVA